MEKNINKEVATVFDEFDGILIEELDSTLAVEYVKTKYFVERKPFESTKTKGQVLYGYTVNEKIGTKSSDGRFYVKEFNINLSPALVKDADAREVKDGGLYMLLELIYHGDDKSPLYVRESEFLDSAGEKRKIYSYAVIFGDLLVVMKPKSKSDKTVLELITKPYFKSALSG